jgi:hypothetical protein
MRFRTILAVTAAPGQDTSPSAATPAALTWHAGGTYTGPVPPIEVGAGCAGTRVIVEVASVQVEGDRLRGEMVGAAAADWLLGVSRP